MGGTCSFLFFVPPSVHPNSRLVQGTRTLLFRPPAMPSNFQGIDDEAHVFPTSISSLRDPAHPSRPSLGNLNPSFSIEKHFVLPPILCSFPNLVTFSLPLSRSRASTFRLCHAPVPFPSRHHTKPKTESKAVTLKDS